MARLDEAASKVRGPREAATALMWVYFMGERAGRNIKIGVTREPTIRARREAVDSEQMSDDRYVLLAGVRGPKMAEDRLGEYFAEHRIPRGTHREYYAPAEQVVEYILWLRQQWFVSHNENDLGDDSPEEDANHWLPTPTRREPKPDVDVPHLFDDHVLSNGPLAGTEWAWMPDLHPTFQDYFTPTDLVRRASCAMGGIDLDAASHFLANKRLHQDGVNVGEYFHVNKSAFNHDWHGRVWLNPPYGDNERWFARAEDMLERGLIEQLCMISPAHAFTTKVAGPMAHRATAAVLLSPTPEFYNPGNPGKTGTNLPHVIFYWGDRWHEFLTAFDGVGIPFKFWSAVAA